MRKFVKNGFLLLLCALTVLCALSLGVAADQAKSSYVEWELSSDGQVITGNGKVYTCYDHARDGILAINPATRYYFANPVIYPGDSEGETVEGEVRSNRHDGEWIWVKTEDGDYVYTTETGKAELDALLEGDVASFVIMDADWQRVSTGAKLANDLKDLLSDKDTKTQKIAGTSLKNYEYYYVGGTDRSNSFIARQGMVFATADGYYYLHLAKIGYPFERQLFASANTFTLYQLDENTADVFEKDLEELAPLKMTHLYEEAKYAVYDDEDEVDTEDYIQSSVTFFKILFVIIGMVVPVAAMAVSVVIARSEKLKKPRHWYALTVAAAVWLLVAVACFIVILTV